MYKFDKILTSIMHMCVRSIDVNTGSTIYPLDDRDVPKVLYFIVFHFINNIYYVCITIISPSVRHTSS